MWARRENLIDGATVGQDWLVRVGCLQASFRKCGIVGVLIILSILGGAGRLFRTLGQLLSWKKPFVFVYFWDGPIISGGGPIILVKRNAAHEWAINNPKINGRFFKIFVIGNHPYKYILKYLFIDFGPPPKK